MAQPQKPAENIRYLVRIHNTDLPGQKQIQFAMANIKGVSIMFAHAVCKVAQVNPATKAGKLPESDVAKLNMVVKDPSAYGIPVWMFNRRGDIETGKDMHVLTSDLDLAKSTDIKFMQKIRCYKGIRHGMGLPVRGQRTRSNFRKNKGKATGVYKSKSGQNAGAPKDAAKK